MPQLKKLIAESRPTRVVTVGDVVSTEAAAAGIKVDVGIIDGKTMRRDYANSLGIAPSVLRIRNPAGSITGEAWKTVKEAVLAEGAATIFVDGEEDLLTLPAVMEAPEGALIVYGQPSEGIVIVRVTREKKAELANMLDRWRSGHS